MGRPGPLGILPTMMRYCQLLSQARGRSLMAVALSPAQSSSCVLRSYHLQLSGQPRQQLAASQQGEKPSLLTSLFVLCRFDQRFSTLPSFPCSSLDIDPDPIAVPERKARLGLSLVRDSCRVGSTVNQEVTGFGRGWKKMLS